MRHVISFGYCGVMSSFFVRAEQSRKEAHAGLCYGASELGACYGRGSVVRIGKGHRVYGWCPGRARSHEALSSSSDHLQ